MNSASPSMTSHPTAGWGAAIANPRWIKLKGWLAWMFWGLVHIQFLIGFRNRMMVFLN